MKRTATVLLCALVLISAAGNVFAEQKNTGCGLGAMIFGHNESLVSQVAAAGLNWAFCSQPLGISAGTSECERPEALVRSPRVKDFVASNMDALACDMARGEGEYLDTLAVLLEVPEASRAGFYARLKADFAGIYSKDSITSDEVLSRIELSLKEAA